MGSGLLIWNINTLPGLNEIVGAFGTTLNTFEGITSPDTEQGPNPSIITVLSATAADNGARLQCGIVNEVSSQAIILSIRE